jgi:hypothetical protein
MHEAAAGVTAAEQCQWQFWLLEVHVAVILFSIMMQLWHSPMYKPMWQVCPASTIKL